MGITDTTTQAEKPILADRMTQIREGEALARAIEHLDAVEAFAPAFAGLRHATTENPVPSVSWLAIHIAEFAAAEHRYAAAVARMAGRVDDRAIERGKQLASLARDPHAVAEFREWVIVVWADTYESHPKRAELGDVIHPDAIFAYLDGRTMESYTTELVARYIRAELDENADIDD